MDLGQCRLQGAERRYSLDGGSISPELQHRTTQMRDDRSICVVLCWLFVDLPHPLARLIYSLLLATTQGSSAIHS